MSSTRVEAALTRREHTLVFGYCYTIPSIGVQLPLQLPLAPILGSGIDLSGPGTGPRGVCVERESVLHQNSNSHSITFGTAPQGLPTLQKLERLHRSYMARGKQTDRPVTCLCNWLDFATWQPQGIAPVTGVGATTAEGTSPYPARDREVLMLSILETHISPLCGA